MLDDFVDVLKHDYPFDILTHRDHDDYFEISVMSVIPSQRRKGYGHRFMTDVCAEADQRGVIIGISPEGRDAETTEKLIKWYGRLGFSENAEHDIVPQTYVRYPASPAVPHPDYISEVAGGISILTAPFHRFPEEMLITFGSLVAEAGEVGSEVIRRNLRRSASVTLLVEGNQVVGGAALKRPLPSYKARVFNKAGLDFSADSFRYELGYVYISNHLRGRGLGRSACSATLECADDSWVFSTVRGDNAAMKSILNGLSFRQAGSPYTSDRRSANIELHILK